MKKILFIFSVLATQVLCAQELRNITIKAIDDAGRPLNEAKITFTCVGYGSETTTRIDGVTDKDGLFKTMQKAELRYSARLNKNGYYESRSGRLSNDKDHNLKITLRKKEKPISMHAKSVKGRLPVLGELCGYDFMIGDWVAPHGTGKTTDLYFKADVINGEKASGSLTISFPGDHDGICAISEANGYLKVSELKLPNKAPLVGYKPELVRVESGYENTAKPANTSYVMRTRSKLIDGEMVHNYSKFMDGVSFSMGGGIFLPEGQRKFKPEEFCYIEFAYCYNPKANDPNLEFKVGSNLITNIGISETVRHP